MPLLLTRHPFADTTFGLWQIAEGEDFFRAELPLSQAEEVEFGLLKKEKRRLEWLAGRWLLDKLTGAPQRLPLAKDVFSKPFFPENQHLACSLSHSHGIVGALIFNNNQPSAISNHQSPIVNQSCGCDIQVLVEKMPQLASKFLNLEEAEFVQKHSPSAQFDLLHIFWTAKESLYKAYGLKELDFRAHLRVEPFEWKENTGEAIGWIEKNDFRQAYQLHFEKTNLPGGETLIWTTCFTAQSPFAP